MKKYFNFTPIQMLVLGFVLLDLTGALLLHMHSATEKGISQPFIDAIFVSTSAITTTGLSVVDIGSYYSLFGKTIIIILVQIGGLGYMIFIVWLSYMIGSKLSIKNQLLMHESVNKPTDFDIKHFSKIVIYFTVLIELAGALFLGIFWSREFPAGKAAFFGIFHSVSAFCTAGFALFPDGFNRYHDSNSFHFVVNIVCIAGGIGFFVLYDTYLLIKKKIKNLFPRRLSIHSKFVLLLTFIIIVSGSFIIFFSEKGSGAAGSWWQTMLDAVFQAISASTTTGFNTVTVKSMHATSILVLIILMFIGASPGSTGGGIKTTSFGALFLSLLAVLKESKDVNLFKRRISSVTLNKAASIVFLTVIFLLIDMLILTATEKASFVDLLFEVVSAEATVGLSMGITSMLSTIGKVVLSITMLTGRVGPLAAGFSLVKKDTSVNYRFPEEELLVG